MCRAVGAIHESPEGEGPSPEQPDRPKRAGAPKPRCAESWAPRHPHLQLLAYMLGIWEKSEKQGLPLPPVIPLVLYNGQGTWKVSKLIQSFPWLPDRLRPFLPEFQFLLLDLARESVEPLRHRFHNRSVRLAIELMRSIFTGSEVAKLLERLVPDDGPPDRDLAVRFLRVVLRYYSSGAMSVVAKH